MSEEEQEPTITTLQDTPEEQEQPKKKRAKIISACSECRRKKTKCNGEQPCQNCRKSYTTASNCVYAAAIPHISGISMIEKEKQKLSMALEAIDVRLKSIEEVLRLFAQQQSGSARNIKFIGGHHRLPSIHNLSAPPTAVMDPPRQLNNVPNIPTHALQSHLIQPYIQEKNELYHKKRKR